MAKIAIDCDGVLANFTEAYASMANKFWPGTFEHGFVPSNWNMDDRLTAEQDERVWTAIKETPNFWLTLNAYSENVGYLASFLVGSKDNDLWIVTSRVQTAGMTVAKQTSKWISSCGIMAIHNYLGIFPVENSNYKHKIYDYSDIEYSVDDKKETVELCDKVQGHKAFLLDRPWNQDASVKRRIKSLKEFFDAIQA